MPEQAYDLERDQTNIRDELRRFHLRLGAARRAQSRPWRFLTWGRGVLRWEAVVIIFPLVLVGACVSAGMLTCGGAVVEGLAHPAPRHAARGAHAISHNVPVWDAESNTIRTTRPFTAVRPPRGS